MGRIFCTLFVLLAFQLDSNVFGSDFLFPLFGRRYFYNSHAGCTPDLNLPQTEPTIVPTTPISTTPHLAPAGRNDPVHKGPDIIYPDAWEYPQPNKQPDVPTGSSTVHLPDAQANAVIPPKPKPTKNPNTMPTELPTPTGVFSYNAYVVPELTDHHSPDIDWEKFTGLIHNGVLQVPSLWHLPGRRRWRRDDFDSHLWDSIWSAGTYTTGCQCMSDEQCRDSNGMSYRASSGSCTVPPYWFERSDEENSERICCCFGWYKK